MSQQTPPVQVLRPTQPTETTRSAEAEAVEDRLHRLANSDPTWSTVRGMTAEERIVEVGLSAAASGVGDYLELVDHCSHLGLDT